jgi:hypothetical protein
VMRILSILKQCSLNKKDICECFSSITRSNIEWVEIYSFPTLVCTRKECNCRVSDN